ncbi:ATP-binding protein [Streptomyces malaysiense]|uniref:ATP-binding protein n=1 Tax=Streptomyces malaysiense TaxID=1428626 RepID=UPI000A6F3AD7
MASPRGAASAERRFRFELAAHPSAVARARRLAQARLTGWSVCADTCDSAALVISELVTNAIVHTVSTRVVCELYDRDDLVRIAVRDEGCAPGEPHPSPQRPDEEHGRGLLLVEALCRSWGAQEQGSGLLVWAELERRDAAPGHAEPRDDLGWGAARPKPERPDGSDGDEPAEGPGMEHGSGPAPGLGGLGPDHDKGRDKVHGLDQAMDLMDHGMDGDMGNDGLRGTPEQPAHRVPAQHPPHEASGRFPLRAPDHRWHGAQERYGVPDRRPHRASEQRLRERP